MNGRLVKIGIGSALVIVLGFSLLYTWRTSTMLSGNTIADDVQKLAAVFAKINEHCGISSFDYQQNPINFLNTVQFVGSEVGPMNLAHPEKWKGPYLDDNPTVQGKEYMVVRTAKGHFITPGNGVKLPNGLVIGKDIVLDDQADIPALIRDQQGLLFNDKPLAAPMGELFTPVFELDV